MIFNPQEEIRLLGREPGTMNLQVYFVSISVLKMVGRNGNVCYNI